MYLDLKYEKVKLLFFQEKRRDKSFYSIIKELKKINNFNIPYYYQTPLKTIWLNS